MTKMRNNTVDEMKRAMTEAYWIKKFKEQEELIKQAFPGENYKQCLDKVSFGMRYYNPVWVVTDEAHVWSLKLMRALPGYQDDGGTKNKDGEYTQHRYHLKNSWYESVKASGRKYPLRVYFHQLVANYFCDKLAITLFGEEECVPHHIFGYDESASCQWLNRAKHIQYVKKEHHKLLNALQKGIKPEDFEKYGLENSAVMRHLVQNAKAKRMYHGQEIVTGVKVTYNSDGSSQLTCVIPINDGERVWLN